MKAKYELGLEATEPRSRRKWVFRVSDIAEASGKSVRQVRDAIYGGELDPRCLVSLSQYVMCGVLGSRRLSNGKPWSPPAPEAPF